MSATNRGGLERHEDDFYETPTSAIEPMLLELDLPETWEGFVVDAGAGTGAIAECVAKKFPKADIIGIEKDAGRVEQARALRMSSVGFECANFLEWTPPGPVDLVIGNPPFQDVRWDPDKIVKKNGKPTGERGGFVVVDPHLAERFVRRALSIVSKKGHVVLLLRSNFTYPKRRKELREQHPCDVFPLEKRPSFNGSGTDATDYAWHVWGPRRGGKWKVLSNLAA